jgi:hypothetical protein
MVVLASFAGGLLRAEVPMKTTATVAFPFTAARIQR